MSDNEFTDIEILKMENEQLKKALDNQIDLAIYKDEEIKSLKAKYSNPITISKKNYKTIETQTDNYINLLLNSKNNNENNNDVIYEKIEQIKNDYNIKISTLSSQIISQNKENLKLKNEISLLTNITKKIDIKEKEYSNKIEVLKSSNNSLKLENNNLSKIINSSNYVNINELSKKYDMLLKDNNKNLVLIDFLNNEISNLKQSLSKNISICELLKSELNDNLEINGLLKNKLEKVIGINKNFSKIKLEFEAEINSKNEAITEISKLNNLIKNKNIEYNNILKENEQLKKYLNKANEDIDYYRRLIKKS